MMLRFVRRNYNAILTVTFAIACAMALIDFVVTYVMSVKFNDPAVQRALDTITPVFIVSILILYVLIFVRRLRDEYLEKLWLKSARSFAILVLAAPWLWYFFFVLRAKITGHWDFGSESIVPEFVRLPSKTAGIGYYQFEGMDYIFGLVWTYSPILFVALFKWHGWRDRD